MEAGSGIHVYFHSAFQDQVKVSVHFTLPDNIFPCLNLQQAAMLKKISGFVVRELVDQYKSLPLPVSISIGPSAVTSAMLLKAAISS
jgi:hypothetical protein